jgi:hypothetical protein
MIAHKRIGLVLAASLVVSLVTFLFISYNVGKTEASSAKLRARILRRADRRNEKLNAAELDFLRKTSQEEKVEEREFKDEIPTHVPLRAKIRKEKEKEFKDLKNERWARDFELEVKNVGDRPIYYFDLMLITDVKAAAGFRIVAPVSYGRSELDTPGVKATTDDVPLNPGQATILKIHPGQLEAWDIARRKENRPHPRNMRVQFQGLNFGDGTGFWGDAGVALPRKPLPKSSMNHCAPQQNKAGPMLIAAAPHPDSRLERIMGRYLPASFLAANFLPTDLPTDSARTYSLPPRPPDDPCCPAGCTPLISHKFHVCNNCDDQERPTPAFCDDLRGSCYSQISDQIECAQPDGRPILCETIDLTLCIGTAPTPTPSPTPDASPSPEPTCDPAQKPNNSNCFCNVIPGPAPGTSTAHWECTCFSGAGAAANNLLFPLSTGCDPSKSVNDGHDCCVCTQQTCPDGSQRNTYTCECPTPTPTPTPNNGGPPGGGGPGGAPGGGTGCTEYWWVYYESYDGGSSYTEISRSYAGCW